MRTATEWSEFCKTHIKAGYVPKSDKAGMYRRAPELMDKLRALNLWRSGDVILDIGCANGRVAMGLLGESVTYIGLDVVLGCIEFCELAFAENDNYRFAHLDVYNGHYNPLGTNAPELVVLPVDDDSIDVVICNSLFTHLGTLAVARCYVDEIHRILRTGGQFMSSWFRSPPNEMTEEESRTVYYETDIREMLKHFNIRHAVRGNTTGPNDQWLIVAVK